MSIAPSHDHCKVEQPPEEKPIIPLNQSLINISYQQAHKVQLSTKKAKIKAITIISQASHTNILLTAGQFEKSIKRKGLIDNYANFRF